MASVINQVRSYKVKFVCAADPDLITSETNNDSFLSIIFNDVVNVKLRE